MGRKQSGRGKQVYLCVAILIFLSPSACALNQMMNTTMVDATGEEAREHLALGRKFLSRGDYENALKENAKVLSLAGRNTPVAEALFYLGLIHAVPANPARNQGKSVATFKQLITEYPGSGFVEPAKVMVALILESDALKRRADGLHARVDRLNNIVKDLKREDADVDHLKAEHAKTLGGLMQENEKLNRTVDRLNTIIDELKKVDIDVDQKKREQIQSK